MGQERVEDYKDLFVWKRGMELVQAVYRVARRLPKDEIFALSSQIRRASVSIPSNIAEGYGRSSPADYKRFLSIARGSAYEVETQLLLCVSLNYVSQAEVETAIKLVNEIIRMLNVLIPKVNG